MSTPIRAYRSMLSTLKGFFKEEADCVMINNESLLSTIMIGHDGVPVVVACHLNLKGKMRLKSDLIALRKLGKDQFGQDLELLMGMDYVGPKMQAFLEGQGVHWIDMSGNANIDLLGIDVHESGKPNKFMNDRTRFRPATVAGAQILKYLILHWRDKRSMLTMAADLGLDKGGVSRRLKPLRKRGWITNGGRGPDRYLKVQSPLQILDYWRTHHSYKAQGLELLSGRIEDLDMFEVTRVLNYEDHLHVWTGTAAAFLYTGLVDPTVFEVFLSRDPTVDLRDVLKMDTNSDNPNIYLILNSRADTFDEIIDAGGLPIVSPIRAYLDLKMSLDPNAEDSSQILREFIKTSIIYGD